MSQKQYTKAYIEKVNDGEITAIASTPAEDRMGDVVEQEGWDLADFKKAPRILWGHDHNEPAIGKATKIWVEGKGKSAKLMFKMVFQEVTEMGRAAKQLVNDGFLNTFSVGFQPVDAEGNRFTKQKLLEISLVNVPANAQAMMLSYKSLKDTGYENEVINKMGIPVALVEELEDMKKEFTIIKGQVNSAVKGLQHLNPQNGRSTRVVADRLHIAKAAVKAADNILASEQSKDTERNAKIIKKSSELIIRSLKGELENGKNKRTSGEKISN